MTSVRTFLAGRSPAPPPDLAAALHVEERDGAPAVVLTAAALSRLTEARARLGRVRESAFRLLEADALLTYACEGALESQDPQAALERILAAAGR